MFTAKLLTRPLETLLYLAMVFDHYRQWRQVQAFVRQRDPFFTDPPVTI